MTPTDQTRIAAYYDAFLPHLAADHQRENERHGRVKTALSALVRPGMSVLDLGCGTGITSRWMGQLGAKVWAMDISPANIAFANEHSAHPKVRYYCTDITSLDLQDVEGAYDGIVLADVFEHIPAQYIDALLDTVNACAGPQTWIYLNIPDGRYQAMARAHLADRMQLVDNGYQHSAILNTFRRIGFEAVSIDIYGIDVACQYNAFVFRRRAVLTAAYKSIMTARAAV